MPLWGAVVATSLSFAFMHGLGMPLQMLAYFAAGIVFSMVYLGSKDLLPVMAVHAAYNLMAILVQLNEWRAAFFLL